MASFLAMIFIRKNLFYSHQLFFAKRQIIKAFERVRQLLRPAGADQNGSDSVSFSTQASAICASVVNQAGGAELFQNAASPFRFLIFVVGNADVERLALPHPAARSCPSANEPRPNAHWRRKRRRVVRWSNSCSNDVLRKSIFQSFLLCEDTITRNFTNLMRVQRCSKKAYLCQVKK